MPHDLLAALWSALLPALEPFGALGVLTGFLAGLMPRRGLILVGSALCSACFAAHYVRLGSPTGAAMCLISVLQSFAAIAMRPGASRAGWLKGLFGVTSLATIGLTALTWGGSSSALAGTGALLATAARWQTDAQAMRALLLACTLAWAGHNILVGSLFGLACDLLTITGLGSALWRYRAGPVPSTPQAVPA